MTELPRITTKETSHLRDDYPSLSHLEAGNVAEWLQERKEQLVTRARRIEADADTTRVVGIVVTGASLIFYAVNPLVFVGGLVGGAAWLWFVVEHFSRTKEFAPLPFVRGNMVDALARIGDYDARHAWEENHLAGTITFLPRYEAEEFVFLYSDSNFEQLTQYLVQTESGKRFHAYRWLLGWYTKLKGRGLPTYDNLHTYLTTVQIDSRVNVAEVQRVQQYRHAQTEAFQLPVSSTVDIYSLPPSDERAQTAIPTPTEEAKAFHETESTHTVQVQKALLHLPLPARAEKVIALLQHDGFDLTKCVQDQITVIAGNQRGGKGTLMAMLAVVSQAVTPTLKVHYFTAGGDVYPFQCERLVCRFSYPDVDGSDADAQVAKALFTYLKQMDNAADGQYQDVLLVIDEAVALSSYLAPDQREWMIKFLFTRASKKGAQIFIVLHGKNLSSWVGNKTAGMAETFKTGAAFIGCEATSVQVAPLKKIAVATGHYFLTDATNFERSLEEIGTVPQWLKECNHPLNGQPDPARTLLTFFPELHVQDVQSLARTSSHGACFSIMDEVSKLESLFQLDTAHPDAEAVAVVNEEFLHTVITIVTSAASIPVSFHAIRNSRRWEGNNPSVRTLRRALEQLVSEKRVKGNEKDGYYIEAS
ncbi:hypothetical protein [Calothrix sp. NIES-2098]|uniref:hypothetical protein n=1 Tax=Calothrix sp. NIES-2098 TaxID=1954171 RepID=UPI000B5F37E2|nr:hypothetical protein NIES2098_12810 [Calothrix sp. NIES-2098]